MFVLVMCFQLLRKLLVVIFLSRFKEAEKIGILDLTVRRN